MPEAIVQFSLVRGWNGSYPGTGTSGLYPQFVDFLGPDGLEASGDEDLRLLPGSPGVDAGRNNLAISKVDLDGLPRLQDDPAPDTGAGMAPLIDIGAYERRSFGDR